MTIPNKISKYTKIFAFVTLSLLFSTACGKSGNADSQSDSIKEESPVKEEIPQYVTKLREVIKNDDPEAFASIVSYPLQRPYPLRDIVDSAAMTNYYPIMVDDSIKSAINNSKDEDWSSNGWRGWTLRDGDYLWIDDKLYSYDYLSKTEKALLAMLIREEMESVSPEYRDGWVPALCLSSDETGEIFRIDRKIGERSNDSVKSYRLSVYGPDTDLHMNPDIVMEGKINSEGSADVIYYEFSNGRQRAKYFSDDVSDESKPVVEIDQDSIKTLFTVKNVYWRDYVVRPRKHHRNR